jgi:hypothetical protein
MAEPRLGEQLLVGASHVLYAKGYHASSVNDIVAVAGGEGFGTRVLADGTRSFRLRSHVGGKREIG